MITVHFDGACEYNPDTGRRNPGGIATYAWVVKDGEKTLAYGYGEAARGDTATNNLAEYQALISSLEALTELGIKPDEIKGDSQLVVYQVMGEWRVNKPHLAKLCNQARKLLNGCKLSWVPREQNEEADGLSKKAYDISRTSKNGPWYERRKITR